MLESLSPNDGRLVPGMSAPRTGVYRVLHRAHRVPHTAIIRRGERLPECRQCGKSVRYVPMVPAEPLQQDPDFAQSSSAEASA